MLATVQQERVEDPHLITISKAVPAVASRLCTMTAVMDTGFGTVGAALAYQATMLRDHQEVIHELKGRIEEFLGGSFSLQFTPASTHVAFPCPIIILGQTMLLLLPTAIEATAPQPVPIYRLCCDTRTIPKLWREWTEGIGATLPIEELNQHWGTCWQTGAEHQFYSTCKVIIDEVRRLGGEAGDFWAVVRELEEQWLRAGASLDKVQKALRAAAKGREGLLRR